MTSNIGARHLISARAGLPVVERRDGFREGRRPGEERVKRTFNPEFLNRVDEIILFMALSEADLIQILELMVSQLNQNWPSARLQ